jgi:hypothetical protein
LQGSGVKVPVIHITHDGITAKWSDLVAGPIAQLQGEFEDKFNPKGHEVTALFDYRNCLARVRDNCDSSLINSVECAV